MNRNRSTMTVEWSAFTAVLVWLLLCSVARPGERGQTPQTGIGEVSNFSTSEYYEPPHERQMKFRLTGANARRLAGGNVLLSQMQLELFRETGQRDTIIEAPECTYDTLQRVASSPGQLHVQSGDGRLSVDGEGFLWQQDESLLTVSNDVRALVRRADTNALAAARRAPLQITSQSLDFDATNRHAIFRDKVVGTDPEMDFACGTLTVSGSPGGGSYDMISAEKDATITSKVDGRSARADRAVYTRADERIELSGHTSWKQGRQEGRADHAIILRAEQSLTADGNVALKLPRESLGVSGIFVSDTNAPAAGGDTSALVDLFADHLQSKPEFTVAEGAVRVVDETNRLTCGKLTVRSATGAPTNTTVVAEQDVVVERGSGRLASDAAVFTTADATAVFTGNPRWSEDQIDGRAERVIVRTNRRETRAEGGVDVKVQFSGQGASLLPSFAGAKGAADTNQTAEIFAREFTAQGREAIFAGDVHAHQTPITGSEPRLRSDTLQVRLAADRRHVESVTASEHVVFEQGTPGATNGPAEYRRLTAHTLAVQPSPQSSGTADAEASGDVRYEEPGAVARGAQANYTGATDTLKVTGGPSLVITLPARVGGRLSGGTVTVTDASVLTWDRASGLCSARGQYRIAMQPHAAEREDPD